MLAKFATFTGVSCVFPVLHRTLCSYCLTFELHVLFASKLLFLLLGVIDAAGVVEAVGGFLQTLSQMSSHEDGTQAEDTSTLLPDDNLPRTGLHKTN